MFLATEMTKLYKTEAGRALHFFLNNDFKIKRPFPVKSRVMLDTTNVIKLINSIFVAEFTVSYM